MNINYQVARNLLYQAIKSLKTLLAGTLELLLLFLYLDKPRRLLSELTPRLNCQSPCSLPPAVSSDAEAS